MSEQSRLEITKKLIGYLEEENNDGLPLHQQADELAIRGQLQPALRLCRASMEIAHRENNDQYILGAARFHMALAYYLAESEKEWDRAAELCEQAAQCFKSKGAKRQQGVSLLARAFILETLCDKNLDRWQPAMRSFAESYTVLRQVGEHLGEEALDAYGLLGRKYVEKGLADEAAAKEAATAAAGSKTASAGAASSEASASATSDGASGKGGAGSATTPPSGDKTNATGMPSSSNGTDPKSKSGGGDKTAEAAAPKTSTQRGLRSKSATLENSFGWWQFGALTALTTAAVLVTFLAIVGIFTLLQIARDIAFVFSGLALLGILGGVISIINLYRASQLVFTLAPDQVAVVFEGGRIWTIEDAGRHILFPFHQDLAAIIPLKPKPFERIETDAAISDARALDVYIKAEYSVAAADVFWNSVLFNIKRSHVWKIPRPLAPEVIQSELDKQAQALLAEAVIYIANDTEKRRVAFTQDAYKAQVLDYLDRESGKAGIRFENVVFRVTIYKRDGTL